MTQINTRLNSPYLTQINTRLNSPYLTQGRNYPKKKIYYKWNPYDIVESGNLPRGQCNFYIDKLIRYGNKLKIIRLNCLHYLGHGIDHSNDQTVIVNHNKSMEKVGITLAWMTHLQNEFNETW
jgi:hypothetical protein